MNEQTLTDIGVILNEVLVTLQDDKSVATLQTSLDAIATTLTAIKDRADPDTPDATTPVIEALSKLERAFTTAINGIEVSPNVQVDAPNVQVDVPKIDLTGIETVLKTDLPQAFNEAISGIPQPTDPDPIDWTPVLNILQSIDTAVRLSPTSNPLTAKELATMTLPTTNTISLLTKPYDQLIWTNPDGNDNYQTLISMLGVNIQNVLSLTYDANSNITDIHRTT